MSRRTLTADEVEQLDRHGPVQAYGQLLQDLQEGLQNDQGSRITVYNGTGGDLTKGQLVYVSGWDATNSVPQITLADADSIDTVAELVLYEDIVDTGTGEARGVAPVGDQNTAGIAVGTVVYLSGTAGAFTATIPTGAQDALQAVGRVTVQHATTGEVYFYPERRVLVSGDVRLNNGEVVSNGTNGQVQLHGGAPTASATVASVLIGATAIAGGDAAGTVLGSNQVVGYAGDFLNFQQNGVAIFNLLSAANAVNGISAQAAATGVAPSVSAIGSDANIGIVVQSKGTGNLTLRSGGSATGNVNAAVWNGAAYANVISAASAALPTLALAATGGITMSAAQPASVGTTPGTEGADILVLTGIQGGETSIATTGVGGKGGDVSAIAGAGGAATAAATAATGGAGGNFTAASGAGAAAGVAGAGDGTGGDGGILALTGGDGGAVTTSTGTNTGGIGGPIRAYAGAGGAAQDGTDTGGAGGYVEVRGGAGGASDTGGAGGSVYVVGGAAGAGGAPAAGNVVLGSTQGGTWRGDVVAGGVPAGSATRALLQVGQTAIVGGSGAGTVLGTNQAVGYAGNLVDFQQNGVALFTIASKASAVNGLKLSCMATGEIVTLETQGSDANVGLYFTPKGSSGIYARTTTTAGSFWSLQCYDTTAAAYRTLLNYIVGADPALNLREEVSIVGTKPADVAGATGTTPSTLLTVTGTIGGDTTIATTGAGGPGSPVSIASGAGGVAASAVTASTGGAGGAVSITSGQGGDAAVAGAGDGTGGDSGAITIQAGDGGAANTATGTNLGGTGGLISVLGGTGGAATNGTDTGGAGSDIHVYGGAGGAGDTGGVGGGVYIVGGAAGAGGAPAAGNVVLCGTQAGAYRGDAVIGGAPAASNARSLLRVGTTAISGGSVSGTFIGANAVVGFAGNLIDIQQANVTLFGVDSIANAVNGFVLQAAATGVVPTFSAVGSDADVGLIIQSKGTGSVTIRSGGGATGNVYLTCWNGASYSDLVKAESAAAPVLTLYARDVDAAAEVACVTITSANDPTILIGASGGVTVTQQLKTGAGNGAAGTGVTAVEYGDGTVHQTVLTLTLTGANDLDIADGADAGDSAAIYTFPEGRIGILGVTSNLSTTVNSVFEATPNDTFDVGVGTAAAGADATLTGTEQNLVPVQTNDTASSVTLTHAYDSALAVSAQFDGTGAAVVAYFNAAVANAAINAGLTIAVTGTVTITWVNYGDY